MRCQLVWQQVALPIQKGTQVGELYIYADGQVIKKLLSLQQIVLKKPIFMDLHGILVRGC